MLDDQLYEEEVMTEERKKALETIMAFIETKDIYPSQGDYDYRFTQEEQKQLIKDLGAKASMKKLGIVHPAAIFNIAALREHRRRKGEIVHIDIIPWDNSMLFENPI